MRPRIALGALVLMTIATGTAGAQAMVFPSPDSGTQALARAARAGDVGQLARILGLEPRMLQADDDSTDAGARERFVAKYEQMHRVVREPKRTAVLYIGAENWPFPVPLDSSDGVWHFDAEAGKRAVLYRRIGQNELVAIAVCQGLAAGAMDVGAVPAPFHGYAFKRLAATKNGFVGYPVQYRSSGVMTFVVDGRGTVYQKDNGPTSERIASGMTTAATADDTWKPVDKDAVAGSVVPAMVPR